MGNTKSEIQYSIPISEKIPGESCIYRHPLSADSLILTPHPEIHTMQDAILKSFIRFADSKCLGTRIIANGFIPNKSTNLNHRELSRNPSGSIIYQNQTTSVIYPQLDDQYCCGGGGQIYTNQTNYDTNQQNNIFSNTKLKTTQVNPQLQNQLANQQQYFSVTKGNELIKINQNGNDHLQNTSFIGGIQNNITFSSNTLYQHDYGGAKTELERQKRIQQIQRSTHLSYTEKQQAIQVENKKFELQKSSLLTNGKNNLIGGKSAIQNGQYCWKTYRDIHNTVKNLATGIKQMNLAERNEEQNKLELNLIGIWSTSREEWVMVDCTNILYGNTTVPIPEQIHATDLSFILEDTQISTLFLGVKELERFYRMIRNSQKNVGLNTMSLGNLKNIVCFEENIPIPFQRFFMDQIGLNVMTLKFIIDKGALLPTIPLPKISPDNIISFCYTTRPDNGKPIAGMISHRNIVSFLASIWNISHLRPNSDDVYLSYLPLSHIYERSSVLAGLYAGVSIGFYSGEVAHLMDDMFELRPTIFCSVPSIYNRIYQTIYDNYFKKTEGLEKWIHEKALESKLNSYKSSPTADVTHTLYDNLIFKSIKQSLGGRLRLAFTSSAPIFPHVHQTLKLVLGVPIIQAYGLTQCSGPAFLTSLLDSTEGHVGGPALNTEFKIIDALENGYTTDDKDEIGQPVLRGELCLRGPGIFEGYFREQEYTKKDIDNNGWLHTGDIVQMRPNGSIKIIDTKKNIFKIAQGEYISPDKLERIYQDVQSITDIYVYGSPLQKYLVAIVVPKKDFVDQIAKEQSLPTISYHQNCKHPQVKLNILLDIQKHARKQKLYSYEIIQKVYIETTPFSILGLVTPSNQLKRQIAYKQFKQAIDSLYEFD